MRDKEQNENLGAPISTNVVVSCTDFIGNKIASSLVTLTPNFLRFPYNDPEKHSQSVTIWNRTTNSIKCRINSPDPEVFLIAMEGSKSAPVQTLLLHGLAAKTMQVKCTPGLSKIAQAELDLSIHTFHGKRETVPISLQIYPSTDWFVLPKKVTIPDTILGKKAYISIPLPQPFNSERFFVTFHPSFTYESIHVSPMNGVIGGNKSGIKHLRVVYAPKQFTTVRCPIFVHFPGMAHASPHETNILARCRPGTETDVILKEVVEIETFRPKPTTKIPRMRMKQILSPSSMELRATIHRDGPDLFTNGGVAHFLIRNDDNIVQQSRRRTSVELLASQVQLSHEERRSIYNAIKAELGLDMRPSNADSISLQRRMTSNQLKHWDEFQRVVGVTLLGKMEEPSESGFEPARNRAMSARKSRRTVKTSTATLTSEGKPNQDLLEFMRAQHQLRASKEEKRFGSQMQLDFTPRQKFIQAVRTIILRVRADKRIEKLRVLISKTRKTSTKKSSHTTRQQDVGSVDKPTVPSSKSNPSSAKKESFQILFQNWAESKESGVSRTSFNNDRNDNDKKKSYKDNNPIKDTKKEEGSEKSEPTKPVPNTVGS